MRHMRAQAMGLMLPPAVQREDAPDDPVAAKLECMTLNGAPAACCPTRPSERGRHWSCFGFNTDHGKTDRGKGPA